MQLAEQSERCALCRDDYDSSLFTSGAPDAAAELFATIMSEVPRRVGEIFTAVAVAADDAYFSLNQIYK